MWCSSIRARGNAYARHGAPISYVCRTPTSNRRQLRRCKLLPQFDPSNLFPHAGRLDFQTDVYTRAHAISSPSSHPLSATVCDTRMRLANWMPHSRGQHRITYISSLAPVTLPDHHHSGLALRTGIHSQRHHRLPQTLKP